MSGPKSSKKGRDTVKPVAAETSLPTENKRFEPGPNFKAVSSCTTMDESSIHDGRKELWLLQFPKDVNLQGLQDIRLEIDDTMPTALSGTLGRLSAKNGAQYSLVQESGAFSDQLFVAAGKGLHPISKRITLEREVEVPVKRPLEEEEGDDIGVASPEKKLKTSGKKEHNSDRKEKKKEKKKHS